jgi:putative Mg2+ transporter-C (MgtC) family protein
VHGVTELSPEVFFQIFFINVGVAILCGGTIGLERQMRQKPAGLRVCILVVLTSASFTTMGVELSEDVGDAVRVLSALMSAVGFLGAGVIFSQSGRVQGITTATLIWALAAVGAVIGFGFPATAIAATLVVMGVLWLIDRIERQFPALRRNTDSEGAN